MAKSVQARLDKFMNGLKRRNPGEPEFHQAVYEVAVDIIPFIHSNPQYQGEMILERLTEPDRIIIFRVGWEDDMANIHENCVRYGKEGDFVNYHKGANIAAFIKIADAMLGLGIM